MGAGQSLALWRTPAYRRAVMDRDLQMRSEHWQIIEELFQAALDREPAERAAFIAEACGADKELADELRRLLRNLDDADGFLESSVAEVYPKTFPVQSDVNIQGKRIGPYAVLRPIG